MCEHIIVMESKRVCDSVERVKEKIIDGADAYTQTTNNHIIFDSVPPNMRLINYSNLSRSVSSFSKFLHVHFSASLSLLLVYFSSSSPFEWFVCMTQLHGSIDALKRFDIKIN